MAYRQPVSRGQISSLRGRQRGRRDAAAGAAGVHRGGRSGRRAGQPALFGTTDLFLERLGLDSLEQLPPVEDFLPGPEVAGQFEQELQAALGVETDLHIELGPTTAEARRRREPRANGCRRCWPGSAWARGGSART